MISEEHINELRALCAGAAAHSEAGIDYAFLPGLQLPPGCNPPVMDCLLCLGQRDGYENRLFFPIVVSSPVARNWNTQNVRILERNWFAYSWRVPGGLRPIEVLIEHFQALRP